MAFESDKIMFEIYREESFSRKYRVVYFTELDEHNKQAEINAAMAGQHFYDGFLKSSDGQAGKQVIADLLVRLNRGERISSEELDSALGPYVAA
jgi:hypothetical protein